MSDNKEWNGTGLPPVGVECEVNIGGEYFKVLILATYEGYVWVQGEISPVTCPIDQLRPLPLKPKKIDMTKFAGSDVWLVHINNEDKRYQAKEFENYPNILREAYRPMFDVWNHWTGSEKPEWLEGFEYEIRFLCNDDGNFYEQKAWIVNKKRNKVVAIKITGVKEGWEL